MNILIEKQFLMAFVRSSFEVVRQDLSLNLKTDITVVQLCYYIIGDSTSFITAIYWANCYWYSNSTSCYCNWTNKKKLNWLKGENYGNNGKYFSFYL